MSEANEIWRKRIYLYAPLLLWIGVIFFLSSTQGAASNTSRFVRPLLEWLFPGASVETLTVYHGYVRKFAHFAEYFVLGLLAWRAFGGGKEKRGKGEEESVGRRFDFAAILHGYSFLSALLLVVLIAALDETNQSFNAARTGSVYDVLLDASGGAAALLFLWLFTKKQPTTTAF